MPGRLDQETTATAGLEWAPVPAIIIGGFLGAGKTTLLNHILSERHGVRAGVLVNDFGAINIDAKLVVAVEGETVSLANGCVCCSIRDDLVAACLRLLRRNEPPEILLIETSGISDPVQVANSFLQPELGCALSLDTILAVVDAEQFPRLRDEMAALARVQIQAADLVLLNKVDLVGAKDLPGVRALIHRTAPGSKILETIEGRAPMDLVLGPAKRDTSDQRRRLSAGSASHARGHAFSAWHWSSSYPLSLPKVRSLLEALPDTVYRSKGIVYLEELPDYRVVLQLVGKRYNLRDVGRWGPEPARSEIVVIGAKGALEGAVLDRALDDCIGDGDEAASPVLRLARKIARDHTQWT